MKYRSLGTHGPRVSLVGLGCNNFSTRADLEQSRRVIHKSLDLGITFFDTSDSYGPRAGSEIYLGEILGNRRKDIVLATKFGDVVKGVHPPGKRPGTSRGYILSAVEASLQRLKTDWIDLYQLHHPDPTTPIEETLRALDDLVQQGKVRHIGCSNLSRDQLDDALETAKREGLSSFVSCQDEYSLLTREIENVLMPAMQGNGLGLIPYAPLAKGLLTGKYRRNAPLPEGSRLANMADQAGRLTNDENMKIVEDLRSFAEERGHNLLELAFSWLAARPPVTSIIAGAMTPEQVEGNAAASTWELSDEDLAEIDRITRKDNRQTN